MSWETIVYRRDELYEQVWSKPMREVAKRHGVSDVALAKICRKLGVPLPGRGYWAKKAAGHQMTRPQLRTLPPGETGEYRVERWKQPPSSIPPSGCAEEQLANEAKPEARIAVPETLVSPHHLIRMSMRHLRGRAHKWESRLPFHDDSLEVDVSSGVLDRALRVMDALLKALEARGFKVNVVRPNPNNEEFRYDYGWRKTSTRTRVLINNEWVQFGIQEGYDSIQIPRAQGSPSTPYTYTPAPSYERRPNGKLTLRIYNDFLQPGIRHTWSDGKTRRVENCLNDFVKGLISTSEALRVVRLEREQRRREELEAERRHEELRERREREAKLVCDLDSRVDDWHAAQNIRRFVAAVETNATVRLGKIDPESELERWIRWARARADQLEGDAVRTVLQLRSPPARYVPRFGYQV
jgi:hypothetical protein